jgi:hypothetical protein
VTDHQNVADRGLETLEACIERTVVSTAVCKSSRIESEMKTSDEYVADLEAVVGANIEGGAHKLPIHWDTILDGKKSLAEVRQMQKALRFIKKGVNQTMKEIHEAFRQKSASADLGFLSTLTSKKRVKQEKVEKRRELRRLQDEELAPYEAITHSIDNALLQLAVQTWLEENR